MESKWETRRDLRYWTTFMLVLEEPISRKQQRTSLEPTTTDDQSSLAKRQTSSPEREAGPEREARSGHPSPSFWDTLSKVWLTRGALREFDRRNDHKEWSSSPLPKLTPTSLSGQNLDQINRFGRHGGPNWAHLRGVCSLRT